MIDFRYHIVSIVAVFLALAVGIVLGAGPLKEDIGATLTTQVTQLRQDKADLRTQLDAAQQGVQKRDAYAALVAPSVVADRLVGKTVAVVVLPGADGGLVQRTAKTLTAGGGTLASKVTLDPSWADPDTQRQRTEAVTALASLVKVQPSLINSERLPGSVLAKALFDGPAAPGQHLPEESRKVLDGLRDAGLLSFTKDDVAPATAVVVIAGKVQGAKPEQTSRVTAYLDLLSMLSAEGQPVVLLSGGPVGGDPTKPDPLVSATRKGGGLSDTISSVDDGALPMGQSTLVLAMDQAFGGDQGHYGLGADATAVAPDLSGNR